MSFNRQFESAPGMLAHALARVPGEMGFPAPVRFSVVMNGPPRDLEARVHNAVYRVAREAIVNSYRHSRAVDVVTEIEFRPGGVRVSVRDNGCGIDEAKPEWGGHGHKGLRAMRECADTIGARLRVLSRVTLGTEVELFIPRGREQGTVNRVRTQAA